MKYYGNIEMVSHSSEYHRQVVSSLNNLISKTCSLISNGPQWKALNDELKSLSLSLVTEEYRRYQLDIINECIIPYSFSILSRFSIAIAPQRFEQLIRMIRLMKSKEDYSFIVLNELESMRLSVNGEVAKLWAKPSELSLFLNSSLSKQWDPILSDIRKDIRFLSENLIVIGILLMVYFPLVVVVPMVRILSGGNILKQPPNRIVKNLLIFSFLSWSVINFGQILRSTGYLCFCSAIIGFFISLNSSLLKLLSPSISPSLAKIDFLLENIDRYTLLLLNLSQRAMNNVLEGQERINTISDPLKSHCVSDESTSKKLDNSHSVTSSATIKETRPSKSSELCVAKDWIDDNNSDISHPIPSSEVTSRKLNKFQMKDSSKTAISPPSTNKNEAKKVKDCDSILASFQNLVAPFRKIKTA